MTFFLSDVDTADDLRRERGRAAVADALDHAIARTGIEPRDAGDHSPRALAGTGLMLGFGLVCDYSAIPFLLVFGAWILSDGLVRGGPAAALRDGTLFAAGALASIALLLAYQWAAFGHPLWPAQRYMPPTEFSARGWLGFTMPTGELLAGNLVDPRYGLFAFCPLLVAALAAPFVRRHGKWAPSRSEMAWIGASFVALLVFSSATQFANLQWNTGVRYMVPAVPLLFVAAIPVLAAMHRLPRAALVAVSGAVVLAVTMTREDIPMALRMVVEDGPTLPILIVLEKMQSGYGIGLPWFTFWLIALAIGALLAAVWKFRAGGSSTS